MKDDGITPDLITYNTLMLLYGSRRDLDGVAQVYDSIIAAGLQPNIATYNNMMSVYIQ